MRILIEALGIHYVGGGRSATLNMLNALFTLDTETAYTVLLSQPEPQLDVYAGVRQIVAPVRNRFALRVWAQAAIPFLAREYDLVHFCKNLTVLGVPAKTVVTVYDLTTLLYAELFPRVDVWYWRWVQPRMLRRIDDVVVISQTTAHDLAQLYSFDRDRITTIYPAYAAHFGLVGQDEVRRVREKYGLPENVIIHVGRIDRKKNLSTLVKAFVAFREQSGFDGKLVLVGEEYRKCRDADLLDVIRRLLVSDRVLFTGPVPDADLPGLYGSALLAAFPYIHEGFGIVAAEAMACGTPVIASNAGALMEAVGDAALVVASPYDVESFAQAMLRLWREPELRQELRLKGLRQAARFAPAHAAEQVLALYRRTVG